MVHFQVFQKGGVTVKGLTDGITRTLHARSFFLFDMK